MPLDLSRAKNILHDFVYHKEDFAAAKKEFEATKSSYYEEAIDAGLKIKALSQKIKLVESDNEKANQHELNVLRKSKIKLEALHTQTMPKIIQGFQDFFAGLDKVFSLSIYNSADLENLKESVEESSSGLIHAEEAIYQSKDSTAASFIHILADLRKTFAPLDSELHSDPIDNLVRFDQGLSDLADKSFDKDRSMQRQGYYHRHSKIIAEVLNSYLHNLRVRSSGIDLKDPQITRVLKAFEATQKSLYKSLLETNADNYKKTLGVDYEYSQVLDYVNASPLRNSLEYELRKSIPGASYSQNQKTIRDLLVLDASSVFTELQVELGKDPSFDEYAARIDEKSNPVMANIRISMPAENSILANLAGYRSANSLRKAFHEITANSRYALGFDFRNDVDQELLDIQDELEVSASKAWLNINTDSPLNKFLRDSTLNIFSKVDSKFYSKHGFDPSSALKNCFDTFNMKSFKAYLRDIVQFANDNPDIDQKRLLKFTYIMARSYGFHVSSNKQDTFSSRLQRKIFKSSIQ